jgi:hypothetical protein
MKANIDSIQRVEPHKFSSIELNPHFVRKNFFRKKHSEDFFRLSDVMQNFPEL